MAKLKLMITILLLLAPSAPATVGAEARWLEGVLVNPAKGEPLLYVEYEEPQGGLAGEYFWLTPADGLEAKLKMATQTLTPNKRIKVFAEFEADYKGPINRDLNGFLFEAEVHEIAPRPSENEANLSCNQDLYAIFKTDGLRRPRSRK